MPIERFVEGYRRFEREVFPRRAEQFTALADGQQPPMLLITCSDSRIVPSMVFQADPGELFLLRNAGNIVPPYGPIHGAESSAIEYAVSVLKVRHIAICGHSKCGAMQAVYAPETVEALPAVKAWIGHAQAARATAEGETGEAALDRIIERNVLLQLDHLKTHPSVARGLAVGTLEVHGWVYRFETGELTAHDQAAGTFREFGS